MINKIPDIPIKNKTTEIISANGTEPIFNALSMRIFSIKNLITEYIARYAKMLFHDIFLPDFIRINVSTKNAMKSNKLSYRNVG